MWRCKRMRKRLKHFHEAPSQPKPRSTVDAMNGMANEPEFVEVDAFLNAEAAHAKDLGLEHDTAVEVGEHVCTRILLL